MNLVFSLLTNAIIIAGFVTKAALMFKLAWEADRDFERIIRISSVTTGVMLVVASDRLGLSISDLMLRAIADFGPIMFGVVAVVVPSLSGMLATWYRVRCVKRSENVAVRLAILIGVFATFQFAELYVKAVSSTGFPVSKALIPNLMFTLSVSLYLILRYDADGTTKYRRRWPPDA